MPTYRGNDGDLQVAGEAYAQLRQWSLQRGLGTANSAPKGSAWNRRSPGRKNWQASVLAYFDSADAAQQSAVEGASVAVVFLPGTGATPNWTGTATITEANIESPDDPAQKCPVRLTLTGNGALVWAPAA